MNRRNFLKTTALTAPLAAAGSLQAASGLNGREFYELNAYTFSAQDQATAFADFLSRAAAPALQRAGFGPVGLFKEQAPEDTVPRLFTLTPYPTLEDTLRMRATLMTDGQLLADGEEIILAEAEAPAFERLESSLLLAFEGMARLQKPAPNRGLFELRTYESHSTAAGLKKIEMFNSGEIDIFRRVGLTPVFFGQMLYGNRLPNLTYLLSFKDMADHDQAWNTFRKDPAWLRLKSIPEFADKKIVSKITKVFLEPISGSGI